MTNNKNNKDKESKKKIHMSKIIVPFVIVSIFTFTGLAMYVQIRSGVELSATLIGCFFAFCTGELWMLASIKKSKIKNLIEDDPNTPEDESLSFDDIHDKTLDEVLEMIRQKTRNEEDN